MQNDMKPAVIFRFTATECPGYAAEFLDEKEMHGQLIRTNAGDAVPHDASVFGVGVHGRPKSKL